MYRHHHHHHLIHRALVAVVLDLRYAAADLGASVGCFSMRTFRGPLRWSPLPPPPSTCPLIIIVVVGVALSRAAWSGLVSCCAPHSHCSPARGRRTECRHAGHAISSLPFQILIKHWLRRLRTALLSSSSLLVLSMAAAAIIFCSKTKRETLGLRFMLPPVLSLTVHPSSYCSHSA